MSEKYESNGVYGDSSSKRKTMTDKSQDTLDGDNEESPTSQRAGEYVRELLAEKISIDQNKLPNATRLIDQEISKTQQIGKAPLKDVKYIDIYREKPIKVTVKVLVPVKEHPKFNFVGKLLGPKGNSMKRLQEETMCKMAVLGRGSMKDRQKEEELRNSLDPKYGHLSDDLHVEISALGPPAEAHARVAFALAEVRKYLIPDNNDNIRQEQMREMEIMTATEPPPAEERISRRPASSILRPSSVPRPPPTLRTATRTPVPTPRVMPAKTKIMSILDRARIAMEESYGYEDDPYESPTYESSPYPSSAPPPPPPSRSYSSYHDHPDYETSDYYRESSSSYDSAHAVMSMTRQQLNDLVEAGPERLFMRKLQDLEDQILSITKCPPEKSDELQHTIENFKLLYKRKWLECNSSESRFLEWLCEDISHLVGAIPGSSKARPSKEFGESKRQKQRN